MPLNYMKGFHKVRSFHLIMNVSNPHFINIWGQIHLFKLPLSAIFLTRKVFKILHTNSLNLCKLKLKMLKWSCDGCKEYAEMKILTGWSMS